MGNSQAKEARASGGQRASDNAAPVARQEAQSLVTEQSPRILPPRPRRGSRPDFSFLGLGGNNDRDPESLEARRETKQEREARKAEKERVARLKERERSMREEHVDGGYLVTQGVYVGMEDFNKSIVRQLTVCTTCEACVVSLTLLQIERRLAPFWRGINDFSESWAEHQLMAAARGLPIPPADVVPPELEYRWPKNASSDPKDKERSLKGLMIPITGRSQSFQSDRSGQLSPTNSSLPPPSPSSPPPASSPSNPLFRARARTLASLTTRSSNQAEMTPRELQLPQDSFVNGQPVEAYLYKDASECPICFLYYPPYLNTTRCCEQAICSECFVQIKRPDPHPPEHEQPDPNAPPMSEDERQAQAEGLLVSEVATCPYCKTPEFGITYAPPPFRRGLTYGSASNPYQVMSARSSQTSVSSTGMSPGPGRRRGTSLSATAPEVITTDKIRPDWASKLSTARAHAARRSAAATALHTAAYLMNGQGDPRAFPAFGRRSMLRRASGEGAEHSPNSHLSALAMLAERHAARQQEDPRANAFLPPPRASSSRRSRMDDLEEMMMMEAIRLSLASEEDRRKKEDKDAKKKAKKDDKERKREEKAARKTGLFPTASQTSNLDGASSIMERSQSTHSSSLEEDSASGKGKSVDRERNGPPSIEIASRIEEEDPTYPLMPGNSAPGTSQESLSSSIAIPFAAEPLRRSHLRQMSTASSASSSIGEPPPIGTFPGSGTPPAGSLEPLFNFQSLAQAVIGPDSDKGEQSSHVEEAGHTNGSIAAGHEAPSLPNAAQIQETNGEAKFESDLVSQQTSALRQEKNHGVQESLIHRGSSEA